MFKRMLRSDMVEGRTGVVEIVDIEEETMKKLLEFVYTGEIEDMGDQLYGLFYAADKYAIMGLVCIWFHGNIFILHFTQFNICINLFAERDVTPSNAVEILQIAERHRFYELKEVRDIPFYVLVFFIDNNIFVAGLCLDMG